MSIENNAPKSVELTEDQLEDVAGGCGHHDSGYKKDGGYDSDYGHKKDGCHDYNYGHKKDGGYDYGHKKGC